MTDRAAAPSLAAGALLAAGWATYRARFALFLVATVLAQAPAAVFSLVVALAIGVRLEAMQGAGLPAIESLDQVPAAWLSIGAGGLILLGGLLVLSALVHVAATVLSQGALACLLVARPEGLASVTSAYRTALGRFVPLLGALVLAGFIIGAVLLLVLVILVFLAAVQYLLAPAGEAPPAELQLAVWLVLCGLVFGGLAWAMFAIVRWALFVQAVVLEQLGGPAALKRSAALLRGHWWRTAGLLTLLAVGQAVVSSLVSAALSAPLNWLGGPTLAGVGGGIGYALAGFLWFPLAANTLTVLYLRLQAREPTTATHQPTPGRSLPLHT